MLFSHIAASETGRVLILAHRETLIDQAVEKLHKATGIFAAVECGERHALSSHRVVVASIQSMKRRLPKYAKDHFSLIICDECHHVMSDEWDAVLSYFGTARVLGVTATPDRSDRKSMSKVFQNVAFEIGLLELITAGYLCPLRAMKLPVEVPMKALSKRRCEVSEEEATDAVNGKIVDLASALADNIWDRKALIFLPRCDVSAHFAELLRSHGIDAKHTQGDGKDRDEVLAWFAEPGRKALCNAMLLCLDLKTEILTGRGWVTHETISPDDLVANWNTDGSVFFARPEEIVKRPLAPGEHMVSIQSKMTNIRVTNTHRMIVGCGAKRSKWKKISAQDVDGRDTFPGCGVAPPSGVLVIDEERAPSKRNIQANSYNLRNLKGMSYAESVTAAAQREERRCSMRRKQPHELTIDECYLIGFWIADGHVNRELIRGGLEYTMSQAPVYPNIIKWVDDLLERIGMHSVRKLRKSGSKVVIWSLCRGTGGGGQERSGVYGIEPYLEKNGTPLFWGLSEAQFDALVGGYWLGDGHHGKFESGIPKSLVFNDTKKPWMDLLCAIGSVRGWRCAMYPLPSKNPKHNDQWKVRMIKGAKVCLSHRTNITHEPFAAEDVWCVKTTSKNIITRRGGKVVVMGNTEGYDNPEVDAVCCLRPTKSRALYSQIVGRGTRKYPGKDYLLVIDPLWLSGEMDLCKPADLIAPNAEHRQFLQKRLDEGLDIVEAEKIALADVEELLAARLAEAEKNKKAPKGMVDPLAWAVGIHDSNLTEYEATMPWEEEPPTAEQMTALKRWKIWTERMTRGYAGKLLERIELREKLGLATPRQVMLLRQRKNPNAEIMTKAQAGQEIGSWR